MIQGRELDQWIAAQPTTWSTPSARDTKSLPLVPLVVRDAAVDAQESLWIGLSVPFTYVYDASGEKRRTVQFRGAGGIRPSHLSFAADGRLLVTPGVLHLPPLS